MKADQETLNLVSLEPGEAKNDVVVAEGGDEMMNFLDMIVNGHGEEHGFMGNIRGVGILALGAKSGRGLPRGMTRCVIFYVSMEEGCKLFRTDETSRLFSFVFLLLPFRSFLSLVLPTPLF